MNSTQYFLSWLSVPLLERGASLGFTRWRGFLAPEVPGRAPGIECCVGEGNNVGEAYTRR
jgi:hypothetical protein